MTKVLITKSYLEGIGDGIRYANGGSALYNPSQMEGAVRALKKTLVAKTITANGNYSPANDSADGYSGVAVNVANSYGSGDEGKVVSSGALVSQTAKSPAITANGTYDTTLNNSVTVNVSGSQPNMQSKTVTENGTVTPDSGYDGLSQVIVNVSGGIPTPSGNIVLLHFNGNRMNSGSYTGQIDSNAVLASGGKFGSGCLQTGSVPVMHGMFDLAANDFTLDFWLKSLGTHSNAVPICTFKYRMFALWVGASKMALDVAKSTSSWAIDSVFNLPSGVNFDDGDWHHVAVCRDGATIRVFADGLVANEATIGAGEAIVTPSDDTGIYFFKNQGASGATTATNWQLDEFRLLIGQSAWTAAFTPPTEPYA